MKLRDTSELFEQYREAPQWRGWIFIILFSLAILGWGMTLHMVIYEAPRQWDFGALPSTPAESPLSSQEPQHGERVNPTRQMEKLPGSAPLKSQR